MGDSTIRRGPTKPAKRKRAVKKQRKRAIERRRAFIHAERKQSVAISNRWLEGR